MSRWSLRAVVVCATLSVVASVAALYLVFEIYLPTFNTQETPLTASVGRDRIGKPSRLRRHELKPRAVVVVVVDGLGYPAAVELGLGPNSELRTRGVIRPTEVPFPTFTSPSIITMMSGVDARDHGVRLNGNVSDGLRVDGLVASAVRAGREVTLVPRQFEPFVDLVQAEGAARIERARQWPPPGLLDPPPSATQLWLIHIDDVDEAGHEHGEASAEYKEAGRNALAMVAELAAGLSETALFVLSDHGHLQDGGHGGDEADIRQGLFFAVGPRIKRGAELAERPLTDVASTIAIAAGIPAPSDNVGMPMLDVFDVPGTELAKEIEPTFAATAERLCLLHGACDEGSIQALRRRLGEGDVEALEQADTWARELRQAREAGLMAATSRSQMRRALTALVLILTGLVAAFWHARRGPAVAVAPGRLSILVAAPVLGAATYVAIMLWLGYSPTFSAMAPEEVFLPDAAKAAAAGVALATPAAWWAGASPRYAVHVLLGAIGLIGGLTYWAGLNPAELPPPVVGVLVFQLAPLALAAAAHVLALCFLQRWPRRLERQRER